MEWYLKAVEQGNTSTQLNIVILYRNGEGVPQDYSKAMEWCLKAADQDNTDAMDYSKANKWFKNAVERSDKLARNLENTFPGMDITRHENLKLLKKLGDIENGDIYEYSRDLAKKPP
ncbi:hypothetical protein BGZ76_002543 [Entomortierella beljakovae]|nr:hypothetical protein BGZ76_002543 [Entomortierella beljakovae]